MTAMVADLPADRRRRERMVRDQLDDCTDARVTAAMAAVPRHAFLPEHLRAGAYDDGAKAIGAGQTISQPRVVATMLAALRVQPGDRVLDVGAGSGYAAALLARLCAPGGRVRAVERQSALIPHTAAVLAHHAPEVDLILGDGLDDTGAAYDVIHIGAACAEPPTALIRRLAPAGRLIAPVGPHDGPQRLLLIDGGREQWLDAVLFVPCLGGTA